MGLRPNALLFATLTALLAIVGAWSNDATLSGLWQLPLALLLLGLAYEAWHTQRAQLTMSAVGPTLHALGRASSLRFLVSHSLARELTIELAPEPPASVQIDTNLCRLVVPAGSGTSLELHAIPRQLGRHRWRHARARVAGPLGLAWWTRPVVTELDMQVTPDTLQSGAARSGTVNSGASAAQSVLGAGGEILQLRAYRPGDPQQVIDWKASARRGEPISRDFTEDQHLEIVLAIDAGRASAVRCGTLDRFGYYANIAARLAVHAVVQDDQVGLVVFADRVLATLAPARGVAAATQLQAMLAAVKPVSVESNPLNAALHIRSLVRHRSLVILLTDLDDVTMAGQLASAARLLIPKHLPLIAGLASPEIESLGHTPARSWLDPYTSLAAQDYGRRLERNAAGLRSLGAPTLLSRPAQMERAVFAAYAELRRRRRV